MAADLYAGTTRRVKLAIARAMGIGYYGVSAIGTPFSHNTTETRTMTATATIETTETTTNATDMRGQLAAGKRGAYVLAGNATLTIRSPKTGQRFTFKVAQSDPEKCRAGQKPVHFVKVLRGEDNTGDYAYLGTIFADGSFRVTRASKIADNAPCAVAFSWFAANMESAKVEAWHEGTCGRCGRTLTVPESIESGLGPVCAEKVGGELPEPREPKPADVAPVPAAARRATLYTAAAERAAKIIDAATPAVPFTAEERAGLIESAAQLAVRGPASTWSF